METLIGAVVGGTIAIAGSVLVARHELTRRERVSIHLSLLPTLLSALRAQMFGVASQPNAVQVAEAMEREATVASRDDRRRARTILERTRTAKTAYDQVKREAYENPRLDATPEGRAFEAALGQAVEAAESYRQSLEDRFSLIGRARRWLGRTSHAGEAESR
jgi:hypothetical protein